MEITKVIVISKEDIIENYVCLALDMTPSEYRKKFIDNPPEIFWDIKEIGDHDKGTYERYLNTLEITIREQL